MTMDAVTAENILQPMLAPGRRAKLLLAVVGSAAACWLWAAGRLVILGHELLGTSSYGASWGLTVANVVHVIGISHVGIAVSAAVRILRLDRYRNVARLAEVMTLVALAVAILNIALDVGRPDRFVVNTLLHGRWHAPMVWSATVISLYLASSTVYLYLSLRRDFWLLGSEAGRGLHRLLALGYRDTAEARARHEKVLLGLAIALVPIMISVHSVYGLFFGILSSRPGWANPLQAPYFVLGAVVSGVSALLVVAALLRRAYRWHALVDERVFRAFGALLAFVVFLYLYFVASEHLTAQMGSAPGERAASSLLLSGPFAPAFWTTILAGLLIPFLVLFAQALRERPVNVTVVAAAAAVVNLAMLAKRFLLVVPAQEIARLPLPMPVAPYRPTLLEIVSTLGTYAAGALLFAAALRVVPLFELPVGAPDPEEAPSGAAARAVAVALTLLAGVGLVAWGIATRAGDGAPLKWITGLLLLVAVPLELCLVSGTGGRS